MVREDPCFDDR